MCRGRSARLAPPVVHGGEPRPERGLAESGQHQHADHALPVPGHEHHPASRFATVVEHWGIGCTAYADPAEAIQAIAADPSGEPPLLLIAGSLYLAGEILRLNEQFPD